MMNLTSFCSVCKDDFRTSRSWISCFFSPSCDCLTLFTERKIQRYVRMRNKDVEMLHGQEDPKLTPAKSVDSFSSVGLRFSTTFNPSWKKLDGERVFEKWWSFQRTIRLYLFIYLFGFVLIFVKKKKREERTCTGRENIWWGSAPGRPPSWFWFHSLWWDTEMRWERPSVSCLKPTTAGWKVKHVPYLTHLELKGPSLFFHLLSNLSSTDLRPDHPVLLGMLPLLFLDLITTQQRRHTIMQHKLLRYRYSIVSTLSKWWLFLHLHLLRCQAKSKAAY